ncbi:penicillin acylase family protein [Phycicoccus sp. BSK3Z-2]|uniref:Penicillin acylase family protein n=1 Tax=Phycicoccus avicenniae TaxID=2828860 RepID=A0A941DBX1_9MICO|nr:penicillin acylase family protein [Phycicoccus avicenniae]MBR7744843.1 penicillin acylase family protein [Phycicoccus avicenniae]
MPRLVVARRLLLGLLAVVVVVAVVASVVVVSAVRDSLPTHSGEASLPGLDGEVEVLRDDSGVPHIYGDSITDLARAQGYVHAQERFFQMDLRRHITAGRLSELVGAAGLETDKVIRTMGWRRVAEEELPTLEPQTRRMLQGYADGVNRYLRGRSPGEVSAEYTVLGLDLPLRDIEEWTPVDSLAWLKAMAWDLRGDYADELARAQLSGRVSPEQIAEIYPRYEANLRPPILSADEWRPGRAPGGAATPTALREDGAVPPRAAGGAVVRETTGAGAGAAYAAVRQALDAVPELVGRGEGVGSNSWVVAGERTSTGMPLLANDPHLSTSQPGVWIQNGLHCRTPGTDCPLEVSGFSFAGVPGVIIGHNADIAWGFTNLNPDVTDFFLERVRGDTYRYEGQWQEFETREETISVAGGADQTITVRSTGHGPVMSDVLPAVSEAGDRAPVENPPSGAQDYAVSLAWTGLLPGRTADAILGFNLAGDWDEFREAARAFAVPAQNLVYADTEGHIGYQAPGQVPVRRSAIPNAPPGFWPAPGWDARYDWQGFVEFTDLPSVLDPEDGLVVAANQAVVDGRRPFLTTEWAAGWRSTRILQRVEELDVVTPDDMRSIQLDDQDLFAQVLVPALLGVPLEAPEDEPQQQELLRFTEEARTLLRAWDRTTPAADSEASAAAAYYNAVWSKLTELLFDDELPPDLRADGGARWRAAVQNLLADPESLWWDNALTPNVVEGRDEILRQALVEARLELTRELGKDPESWDWGKLHRATLEHPVLGGEDVPAPVRALFNEGPFDLPGGSAIVNANAYDNSEGFEVTAAPSMRMVVDLADLDASTWIDQTGVSGHVLDDHWGDQTQDWVSGVQRPWPFSREAVEATDPDVLVLRPDAPSGP